MSEEGLEEYGIAAATLVGLLELLDEDDPRYVDAAYNAGEFFAKVSNNEQAVTYFRIAAEKGTGLLKERAEVAVELLSR